MSNDSSFPGDDRQLTQEQEMLVVELTEQHLENLQAGIGNVHELIAAHPELAPVLGERLEFAEKVFAVSQLDKQDVDSEPSEIDLARNAKTGIAPADGSVSSEEPRSLHPHQRIVDVSCPNCGIHIHLIDSLNHGEITCNTCGSTIQYDTNATQSVPRTIFGEIGRFRVISILGQGAFGCVYKAMDPNLERFVAIKVPRIGTFSSNNQYARFLREARNAARLRHENIVQVHEIIDEGNFPYIVSEFVEGLTLDDLIIGQRLTATQSVEFCVKISEAIEYANEQGVIHRDIKPSNILIDSEQVPYVTDFGLAHDDRAEVTMTVDGEILGTPAFMSPEQARGENSAVDRRSDVYSLGVTLFKMLCGELPFRGSRRMLMHKLLNDDAPPIRKLNESVPRELETIVAKAMAKAPDDRYQSAQKFADDLNRWLRNEPILAKPISNYRRLLKWCGRNPRVASLSLSICGLLVLGMISSLIWANQLSHFNHRLEANIKVSQSRLEQLYLQKGVSLLTTNKAPESLTWFNELLNANPTSENADLQRIRIQNILDQTPTLTNLWEMPGGVAEISYSPNGEYVLLVGRGKQIAVVRSRGGERVNNFNHDKEVQFANFDPIGKSILSVSDTEAYLWDIEGGQLVRRYEHNATIRSAIFDGDNKRFATASIDGVINLWDSITGENLRTLDYDDAQPVMMRFFDSGKRLAIVGVEKDISLKSTIGIWNAESGERVHTIAQSGRVTDVAINTANTRLLLGTEFGTVSLWDLQTKEIVNETIQTKSRTIRVGFNESKKEFFVVAGNGTVTRGESDTGRVIVGGLGESVDVVQTKVNLKAGVILSACADGNIRLNWLDSGSRVCDALPHGTFANAVDWHTRGRKFIAAGNDGVVKEWSLAGLAPKIPLLMHQRRVSNIRLSKLGDRAITVGDDATGRIWNTNSGVPIGPPLAHDGPVLDCAFVDNGNFVVTVGEDLTARVWDAFSGEPVGLPRKHTSEVIRVASNPEGRGFVTGTEDGTVFGWNVDRPEAHFSCSTGGAIYSISFSSSGKYFATASQNGNAFVWNAADGTKVAGPLVHDGPCYRIQFDPTENFLAVSGEFENLTIWAMDQFDSPWRELPHRASLFSLDWSPDGMQVVTTDGNGNATVWEKRGQEFFTKWQYEFGNYQLRHAEFGASGRMIVLCGVQRRVQRHSPGNGVVFLVDAATGESLAPVLVHSDTSNRVRLHPKDELLVSCSADHSGRIWPLSEYDESDENLSRLLSVLSGKRLNDRMQLEMLAPDEMKSMFESISISKPELTRPTKIQTDAWDSYVEFVDDGFKRAKTNLAN